MNRLWVRLTLAFVLVAALSGGMAALVANRGLGAQFQRYLAQNRLADLGLLETLQDFYTERGAWVGVDDALGVSRGRGQGFGPGGGQGLGGPGGIVVSDADGRIVSPANRAGASLSAAERDIGAPVVVDGKLVGIALVSMPGNAQFTAAASLFLSEINQVLLQAAGLAAVIGALAGLVIARGIGRPLSDLATAALRVAAGKLDERVAGRGTDEIANVAAAFNEMTVNLQRADQERKAAETLRRNMVADIAHEPRTPLTVMQGNLQAILDDVYPLTKAEIATVFDETATLRQLVNDLRELSLAEAGQLTLALSAAPVGPLIESAAARLGDLFESRGITLGTAIETDLPNVTTDADRTTQVLVNLLTNALRYTPAGGQVTVRALRESAGVRVEVADTGPGIPTEDLPRVFDRFWRGEKSRARETGGSGLGLAIARQWVVAMGGEIDARSEPGQGSVFWFRLKAG